MGDFMQVKCFVFSLVFSLIIGGSVLANTDHPFSNLPEAELGLPNILNIILITVGVVLILLGIAILIRLKK